MSDVRAARVVASEPVGPALWRVTAEAEAELGALPGQWGAFHTDLPNPQKPGQTLRRAWSFARIAGVRFDLVVAVVGDATRWLASRRAGDPLPFTGPWGSRFLLDGDDDVGFFAAGSGISAVAPMVDAAVAAGRGVRLLWDVDSGGLAERLEAWRTAGVDVRVGAGHVPDFGRRWWYAGDGGRIDEALAGRDVPPNRVERFFTPRPT